MNTFYITPKEFWDWFDRENDQDWTKDANSRQYSIHENREDYSGPLMQTTKKIKTDNKLRSISDVGVAAKVDARYIILYGPHKPGKKNKIWEGDGYLSLVGQVAHLCDLRGKMLEDPTLLDDIDLKAVKDLGELLIGETEVQVLEIDKRR